MYTWLLMSQNLRYIYFYVLSSKAILNPNPRYLGVQENYTLLKFYF